MAQCKLCGWRVAEGKEYHPMCERTIFQLDEIIDMYKNNSPPEWLSEAVAEFSFIYEDNTRVSAIFNAAGEIAEQFIISGKKELETGEISAMMRSSLPIPEIVTVLEDGQIIEVKNGKILPGLMIKECIKLAERGTELSDEESIKTRRELFGFLGICLTKSLIKRKEFVPRDALAVLNLLSKQMLEAREGEEALTNDRVRAAFSDLVPYQRNKKTRVMAGFVPYGDTKIIRDIDPVNATPYLKRCMVEYTDRMRERFREREREERGRSL